MIILLEVLNRKRKRINIVFRLFVGLSIILLFLSIIGSAIDHFNRIDEILGSSSRLFSTLGMAVLLITIAILVKSGLRYIFLSYYHLDKTLLVKTKYYPEFFIISLLTPIANLIYPYHFLKDLLKGYSCEADKKGNTNLILLMLFYNMLFIINILFGIMNILQEVDIPSINTIYYFELFIVLIFGGLGVKYINNLFKLQKYKLESNYSIENNEKT